jgi:hypothetical protein
MSDPLVYGHFAEASDRRLSFTQIGISVSLMWILMSQALRLVQLI